MAKNKNKRRNKKARARQNRHTDSTSTPKREEPIVGTIERGQSEAYNKAGKLVIGMATHNMVGDLPIIAVLDDEFILEKKRKSIERVKGKLYNVITYGRVIGRMEHGWVRAS